MARTEPPVASQNYELRAPVSGAGVLDPRSALLVWGFGSIVLGVVVSLLLVRGEIRMLTLLLLGVMGLLCLAPRRGVYILIVFLPFMYFVRRQVLHFQSFDSRDPILLFPAVTAVAMFLGVLIFYAPRLFRYFRQSAALKAVVILMGIFILQIFNPLQGSLMVGLGGGMYFLVPMLWCAFGLLLSREDMDRVFRILLVIGLITALYGLKQHYLGMSDVEEYELKAKRFYKFIGGESNVRVMSTFSSLGDFSLYLMVSAFVTFAYLWRDRRRIYLALFFVINTFAMVWLAVRTSFLLLLFSMVILVILKSTDTRKILLRALAALVLIFGLYGVLYSYDPVKMYDTRFSSNPYVVHTLSGLTHPTQENSFKGRITGWARIVSDSILSNPIGNGLGTTTTAASKFEGSQPYEADSYFFEMFHGSSLLAPIVFAVFVISILRTLLRLCLSRPDVYTYRVAVALLAGLFLGCIFGTTARDTITGPVFWLIVGWAVREDVEGRLAPVEQIA